MMSRIASFVAAFSIVATTVNGQIPDGVADLVNLIPPECLLATQTTVIPCFLANPACLTELPTAEDIGTLPTADAISTCDDIIVPACPLLLRCEACIDGLGELLKCIVANVDAEVPQETVDLITSCEVDCSGFDASSSPPVTAMPATAMPATSMPASAAPAPAGTPVPMPIDAGATPMPVTADPATPMPVTAAPAGTPVPGEPTELPMPTDAGASLGVLSLGVVAMAVAALSAL
ncbi:MAG: hypothetical protein SGILL_009612 [Bacillariaceae sp.]